MRVAALVTAIAATGCAHHSSPPRATLIDPAPAPARHDVRFGPGEPGAIVGKLTDDNGNPMVGAVIIVGNVADAAQRQAVSDDTGAFAVRGVSEGTHDVTLYFNDLVFQFGEVATGTEIDATLSASHAKPYEGITI